MWREQAEQGRVLPTQDDHASMFRALGSIRLEARELHSSERRLLVVAREQHNEVSRVLNGLVHLLDKVRGNRNVIVLNEDFVALLSEDVSDLLRNSGHRATAAQEEVVSLTGTAWHGSDPRAQQQWSRAKCLAVKDASYRKRMIPDTLPGNCCPRGATTRQVSWMKEQPRCPRGA